MAVRLAERKMMAKEKNFLLKIPYGMRDFLPGSAAIKRKVEDVLAKLFRLWGYDEVTTPVVEYLDTLKLGNKNNLQNLFKFFDKDNKPMALRNEMTTPIARLVSSRMQDVDLPIKLSYICKVYRDEQAQTGRQCEFYQAGVEFMGDKHPTADTEVVALAIESFLQAGLQGFQVCLGQVEYINGLMQQWQLPDDKQENIREAIERHDLVALDDLVRNTNLSVNAKEFLATLPMLHGNQTVLERAEVFADNERSKKALANLRQIYGFLNDYGVSKYIVFDLGVIRDFSYYTGMVFEIYASGIGSPLCGGGRYDNLLADFGRQCPATGFALGLERLLLALKEQNRLQSLLDDKENYVAYAEGHLSEAVEKAMYLRQAGEITQLATKPQCMAEAEEYCKLKGYADLVYLG